jgi:excisionase family DNA binding protein
MHTDNPPAIRTGVDPLLVSVEEGAAVLGLSRAVMYRLLKAGELRSIKVGSRRLLHVDELRSFAARLAEAAD